MTTVTKSLEQRILLQPRGQDAFGRDEQARLGARSDGRIGRASRPPGRASTPRSSAIRRAIARAATRRGCSRQHRTVVDQRRRHARRLAGAWRRGDHHGARSANGVDDLWNVRVDRQLIHDTRQGHPRRKAARPEAWGWGPTPLMKRPTLRMSWGPTPTPRTLRPRYAAPSRCRRGPTPSARARSARVAASRVSAVSKG